MSLPVTESGDPYPITNSTTSIPIADAVVLGILVSTSATGVITITDSKSRAICTAMPLTAGQFVTMKARVIGPLTVAGTGTFVATLLLA